MSGAQATLVLASASPRRRDLLAQVGITPDAVIPADIDETPHKKELPRLYAERIGLEKALAVHREGQFTLAGDTVVALGRRILPKAETDAEVADCLHLLSGRAHHVLTSLVIIAPDGRKVERLNDTRVILKRLSDDDISAYVASKEGLGKAGGYGIQGRAGAFVKHISGSYTGVMGLPVHEAINALTGLGFKT
ncbi:MAG: Maf family nucleotide pyrophosphatase [Pseudomonadota bacterium]